MWNDPQVAQALPWALSVLLLSVRLGAVFMMTPVLYAIPIPASIRALLVVGLSACLAMGLASPATHTFSDTASLIQAAVRELALGATLGLAILLAFAAFAVAGRLLDVQIGFGIAQVFDPLTRTQLPILSSLFNQIAALVFFLVDGPHALLRALAFSIERFPIGQTWPLDEALMPLLKQAGGLFSLALALAAPVVFCLVMIELALGVVARNLPQMNMFVLGIPVKIVAGLIALSFWFSGVGGVMSKAYGSIYTTWNEVFAVTATGATQGAR